jgi:hypothetical protein
MYMLLIILFIITFITEIKFVQQNSKEEDLICETNEMSETNEINETSKTSDTNEEELSE